jgi:hypothetical protein
MQSDFESWMNKLDSKPAAFQLWREVISHLRYTHDDIWNVVRLFLAINGIIIAGVLAVWRGYIANGGLIAVILSAVGIVITIQALMILKKNRQNFVRMQVLRGLLENELGFYNNELKGVKLLFPWGPDKDEYQKNLVNDPLGWEKGQIWRGKVTIHLRFIFLLIIGIYIAILLAWIIWICFFRG